MTRKSVDSAVVIVRDAGLTKVQTRWFEGHVKNPKLPVCCNPNIAIFRQARCKDEKQPVTHKASRAGALYFRIV